MANADKTSTTSAQTQIDPKLQQYGGTVTDAQMAVQGVNPWDLEYTGPRIAAPNDAQMQVMDETAEAGRAFGFDFTSAADPLRGLSWDPLAMAREGITPEMESIYDSLYGDQGVLSQYGFDGNALAQPAAPSQGMGEQGTTWIDGKKYLTIDGVIVSAPIEERDRGGSSRN